MRIGIASGHDKIGSNVAVSTSIHALSGAIAHGLSSVGPACIRRLIEAVQGWRSRGSRCERYGAMASRAVPRTTAGPDTGRDRYLLSDRKALGNVDESPERAPILLPRAFRSPGTHQPSRERSSVRHSAAHGAVPKRVRASRQFERRSAGIRLRPYAILTLLDTLVLADTKGSDRRNIAGWVHPMPAEEAKAARPPRPRHGPYSTGGPAPVPILAWSIVRPRGARHVKASVS